MLKRIILAVLVGIVTAVVVYIIGLVIALLPGAEAIGQYILGVSVLLGVVAAVYYFLTNKTVV